MNNFFWLLGVIAAECLLLILSGLEPIRSSSVLLGFLYLCALCGTVSFFGFIGPGTAEAQEWALKKLRLHYQRKVDELNKESKD